MKVLNKILSSPHATSKDAAKGIVRTVVAGALGQPEKATLGVVVPEFSDSLWLKKDIPIPTITKIDDFQKDTDLGAQVILVEEDKSKEDCSWWTSIKLLQKNMSTTGVMLVFLRTPFQASVYQWVQHLASCKLATLSDPILLIDKGTRGITGPPPHTKVC